MTTACSRKRNSAANGTNGGGPRSPSTYPSLRKSGGQLKSHQLGSCRLRVKRCHGTGSSRLGWTENRVRDSEPMTALFASPHPLYPSRRDFLRLAGSGCGLLALATLLRDAGYAVAAPHFPAKAKSIIWLFMNGGQSHVDTFDYKPALRSE